MRESLAVAFYRRLPFKPLGTNGAVIAKTLKAEHVVGLCVLATAQTMLREAVPFRLIDTAVRDTIVWLRSEGVLEPLAVLLGSRRHLLLNERAMVTDRLADVTQAWEVLLATPYFKSLARMLAPVCAAWLDSHGPFMSERRRATLATMWPLVRRDMPWVRTLLVSLTPSLDHAVYNSRGLGRGGEVGGA